MFRFQRRSIRFRFVAYGRKPHPIRRLGGRPDTVWVTGRPISHRAARELQDAGMSADLASRTLRTAVSRPVADYDQASTPKSAIMVLRAIGILWRVSIFGVLVAGLAGLLGVNFLMFIAIGALSWFSMASTGGAIHAFFHTRENALRIGAMWLAETAKRAARSSRTGPARMLLRRIVPRPKPWLAAADWSVVPILVLCGVFSAACVYFAAWIWITFDVVWLPTASLE